MSSKRVIGIALSIFALSTGTALYGDVRTGPLKLCACQASPPREAVFDYTPTLQKTQSGFYCLPTGSIRYSGYENRQDVFWASVSVSDEEYRADPRVTALKTGECARQQLHFSPDGVLEKNKSTLGGGAKTKILAGHLRPIGMDLFTYVPYAREPKGNGKHVFTDLDGRQVTVEDPGSLARYIDQGSGPVFYAICLKPCYNDDYEQVLSLTELEKRLKKPVWISNVRAKCLLVDRKNQGAGWYRALK